MRGGTTLALIAGGTLAVVAVAGVVARSRLGGGVAGIPKPVTGMFPNGMAYARWGTGPKTLLLIPGGPGNPAPSGLSMRMFPLFRPMVEDGYTAWYVARKRDKPKGHTIADMADDYAGLIADELGGKVDLVVGVSEGGTIGFYLAARHPERFGHIAINVAGYALSEEGKALDHDFARLMSEGRSGEAGALMVRSMAPGLRVPGLDRVAGAVMGRSMRGDHPFFASDVLVEAEAEVACDAREVLPDIRVPVLLVCGDEDPYFPKGVYEETARLTPTAPCACTRAPGTSARSVTGASRRMSWSSCGSGRRFGRNVRRSRRSATGPRAHPTSQEACRPSAPAPADDARGGPPHDATVRG